MSTTSSRVDLERAKQMRADGMTLGQIGDEFGVSRERIRQLVGSPMRAKACDHCGDEFLTGRSDQLFCSQRCRERAGRASTCECGDPKAAAAARCHGCQRAAWADDRDKRYQRLVELWAQGLTLREMADAIGTTANALGGEMVRARAAGYNLPFRKASSPTVPATKQQCRQQFQAALRNGQVRRAARCERCGKKAPTDGHHTDYARPLYVEWLCVPCHHAHHAEERAA